MKFSSCERDGSQSILCARARQYWVIGVAGVSYARLAWVRERPRARCDRMLRSLANAESERYSIHCLDGRCRRYDDLTTSTAHAIVPMQKSPSFARERRLCLTHGRCLLSADWQTAWILRRSQLFSFYERSRSVFSFHLVFVFFFSLQYNACQQLMAAVTIE